MNRTQGNEDWVVLRPQLGVPSNCIAPKDKVEAILTSPFAAGGFYGLGDFMLSALCAGSTRYGSFNPNVERSEEHTSELQSLMRISYAVLCLKKKTTKYIRYK